MTRLEYIATAYLAGDLDTVESALAFMPRPSTLASPEIHEPESDVARGKMVLVFSDPFTMANIRAVIRATFTGAPLVRVTGRNRHGAREKLESMLPRAMAAVQCAPGGNWFGHKAGTLPPELPPELQ